MYGPHSGPPIALSSWLLCQFQFIFCRVIHGPLLGTCCHVLAPHPCNMPQQWSTLNSVISISYTSVHMVTRS
ncbi:hypothetical protein PAXRUDRAFT_150612 [Paxillus rubicundulus Ve08.2h10]|uniref:Secreted protein n=1 Tax=Paxillus rubicundulus Ve08.2h10 TaxID=930991 RepID=A0A0D0E2G2_9AGAM|nr:hypothetical protein PAXRUDRAFT_150612 [Paxillus rubicundulus Ve08.2h10]